MRPQSWMAVVVVALVGSVSCARDNPTAPPSQDIAPPTAAARTVFPSPVTIVPLQRVTPLSANQQVSATIGIFGGTLAIPSAGLTLIVPPLAVLAPTTITATALAGSSVAYEFAPHGLQFLAPVVATQSLIGTEARLGGPRFGQPLFVGYFATSGLIASVTELLNAPVNLGVTSTALLWHFSGYTWSSGREEEPGDITPPNP